MDSRHKLILYMRPECHLCDQVVGMLQSMDIRYTAEDIERDPELERKYGLIIPVLYQSGTSQELCFPFSDDQLKLFLGVQV